ncbi:MAG: hypothetical protein K1X47_16265 [Cyclobacteriaceae bacterium]|nr:hypothetical protein [Cyclobacteriaceae bacterium]
MFTTQPTPSVIAVVRRTARALQRSNEYQWGHMGLCNCGFLAQQVTGLPKDEIHRRAMLRHGDWREQLNDYCPSSGLPMDDLVDQLLAAGFSREDLQHLERLSAPHVLAHLTGDRHLQHNIREDVVRYLEAWSDVLEEQWLEVAGVPLANESLATGIFVE